MKISFYALLVFVVVGLSRINAQDSIELSSPGLAPSAMDAQGRLVEDWGTVDMQLSGQGVASAGEGRTCHARPLRSSRSSLF